MRSIADFQFFDPDADYTVSAGTLPHWQQPGATYFITYRTNDSISAEAMDRILASRDDWLRRKGIEPTLTGWHEQLAAKPKQVRDAFQRQFAVEFENDLDRLAGECLLRRPEFSKIVADSLLFFDNQRYQLGGFVVMPNHVHVLARINPEWEMLAQCYSWKHFQANEIHRALDRQGRFYQKESFDHLVRDGEHFIRFREYIAKNPEKAKLTDGEYCLYLPPIQGCPA